MNDAARARGLPLTPPQPECWRTIGITGDKSCPELATYIHCRNCPVLAEAARTFFARRLPRRLAGHPRGADRRGRGREHERARLPARS